MNITPELYDRLTVAWVTNGLRVFQGELLAPTEAGHVHCLLDLMAPPLQSAIADMGCGVGEVARWMHHERPDLRFTLINANALQLTYAPACFRQIHCDYHDVPVAGGTFDGAMFCYSLGYASQIADALGEAARLVRPGGFLFVYDYERMHGTDGLLQDRLGYHCIARQQMLQLLDHTGWDLDWWTYPAADATRMRTLYDNDAEYDLIFSELRICAWRAVRR